MLVDKIPKSRLATIDIAPFARQKNHVAALLNIDVTACREKIRQARRDGENVSFNAVLLNIIALTLKTFPEAASFLHRKNTLVQFDNIHISTMVEKNIDGIRVPIPFVLLNADKKSAADMTLEIAKVVQQQLNVDDISFKHKQTWEEKVYVRLPGVLRRWVWNLMLKHPKLLYNKMGNVIVTSVGMMGQVDGWFIQKSIHPLAFGIGSIVKKPWVVDNEIKIRQILMMTVLLDHDVIDGAPMARFISQLCKNIEKAEWT